MLHLERIGHTQETGRTQTERSALGVRGKRDAVALGVRICERRGSIRVDHGHFLTILVGQFLRDLLSRPCTAYAVAR